MDVERDALHSIVEPKLNEYLSKYCCSIEFVDLRHSVKTDAEKDQVEREKRICSVCLDEIDRCSPYFIGLLGHRYGWIPPVGLIDKDDTIIYPFDFENLSVTAHEFVYSLSKKEIKGLVFMRNESSYVNLPEAALPDYKDTDQKKLLIEHFRQYISEHASSINVIPYDLDLADVNLKSIISWAENVCQSIIDLIKDDFPENTEGNELDDFFLSQELYVQSKLKNFCGRTVELEECKHKVENRSSCILSMREHGIGTKSFHCKLYTEYRNDPQNICLFYSPYASVKYDSIQQVIYYWTLYLIKEYTEGVEELPQDWKRQFSIVCSIFDRIIERLGNEGRKVYLFIGDSSSVYNFLSRRNIVINIVFYDQNSDALRPHMYMLKPFRKETVCEIVKPLREPVAKRLIEHKQSQYAEWLSLAVEQLQNMNRIDFLSIRNGDDEDQENNIVEHQLHLIESFPSDTETMTIMWIEKMRDAFGADIIDGLIYLMGLNPYGYSDKEICRILGIDAVMFVIIRQMLGKKVIYENFDGKWSLTEGKIWNELITKLDYSTRNKFNNLLKDYLSNNSSSELHKEIGFKVALLAKDLKSCIRALDIDDSVGTNELHAYKWFASNLPEQYKTFIDEFTNSIYDSYQLIFNLILCYKQLFVSSTREMFLFSFTFLKKQMRKLRDQGRMDSRTFSLLGDVLACEADYYRRFGNFSVYKDCLKYNLLFSAEQMKHEWLWTNYYLLNVIKLYDDLHPDSRHEFLVNKFLKYENSGQIHIAQNGDSTTYAIVLFYTAEELIAQGEGEKGVMLLKKAFAVFNRLLMLQYNNSVETVLKPLDTMRNILLYLARTYYIYENTTDFICFDWLETITDVLLEHCDECKKLYDDQSYWCYYEIVVKKIQNSDLNSNEKISMLYDTLFEALVDRPFTYIVMERQTSAVSGMSKVYFMISAAILKELSVTDGHCYEISASYYQRMFGNYECLLKKEKYETFESLLSNVLPVMGAKLTRDKSQIPNKLKAPMIVIYEAMLNVELVKDNPDVNKITCIGNSLFDEIDSRYGDASIKYRLHITDFAKFISIMEANKGNYEKFEDFTDAFGMQGNVFVESWQDDEEQDLSFYIEMNYNEDECYLPQDELEDYIESNQYSEIISTLSNEVNLTFFEAYYLALAYLRSNQFDIAFQIYNRLLYICLDEKNRSEGEFFSTLTNAMISALMARRIEEFEMALRMLREDDYEDEDIRMILDVYNKMRQDANASPDFKEPYGFIL